MGEKKCAFVLCKNVFLLCLSCKIDCEVGFGVVCGFRVACKRFCQKSPLGCDMFDCGIFDCAMFDFGVLDANALDSSAFDSSA